MLTDPRLTYRPFEYPEAHEYFRKAAQSHWLWDEVSMAGDVADFTRLDEASRWAVLTVLRLFTQVEVPIGEFWSSKVGRWFPKAEVQQMASTFASFEAIHIAAYSFLNDSLGLPDSEYSTFLEDPAMRSKVDRLSSLLEAEETDEAKALSLAVFSGFTEGVSLFSSFAVLLNFGRHDLMKGVGQIVRWSSRDESLHSAAGCWLFRTFVRERPDLWTDDLKRGIYQAARDSVELEDAYVDRIFERGDLPGGLTARQMKAFVRHRANTKLGDLGLKVNWRSLDKEAVAAVTSWFDPMAAGVEHTDFFAQQHTSYARGGVDWSRMYDGWGDAK